MSKNISNGYNYSREQYDFRKKYLEQDLKKINALITVKGIHEHQVKSVLFTLNKALEHTSEAYKSCCDFIDSGIIQASSEDDRYMLESESRRLDASFDTILSTYATITDQLKSIIKKTNTSEDQPNNE